jgi:hypothetical protein
MSDGVTRLVKEDLAFPYLRSSLWVDIFCLYEPMSTRANTIIHTQTYIYIHTYIHTYIHICFFLQSLDSFTRSGEGRSESISSRFCFSTSIPIPKRLQSQNRFSSIRRGPIDRRQMQRTGPERTDESVFHTTNHTYIHTMQYNTYNAIQYIHSCMHVSILAPTEISR